jgi:hypothetical protein
VAASMLPALEAEALKRNVTNAGGNHRGMAIVKVRELGTSVEKAGEFVGVSGDGASRGDAANATAV